jgi:uncharacterized protein
MQKYSISKLEKLKDELKKMNIVAVGFSGGVDSSFLLKLLSDVLGKNTLAITIKSPAHPQSEIEEALRIVGSMSVKHEIIDLDVTEIVEFKKNNVDRCYYCKKMIFSKIKEVAKKENINYVLDASNADDLDDYRPGMKALKELGVISPLIDVNLTKEEIRDLSRQMNLDTWNKPSFACLASRFPYGTEITKLRLEQVEKAEMFLNSLGLKELRVRCHNEIARIEVAKDVFQTVLKYSKEIVKQFKEFGFKYVTLDIEGYRSGSLNEVL